MQGNRARTGRDRLRLRLAPGHDAPAAARRALRHLELGERGDDVLLVTSELVTGVVVQGRSPEPMELAVHVDPDRVRVELFDPGRFVPGDRGYALRILAGAAPRWGIEQDDATFVWFEVPLQ